MPIKQIRNDSITQICARCGVERDIRFLDLELGVEIDSESAFKDANVIALPICEKCGAKEFLLRTWDKSNDPVTSTRLQHRKAVNSLAKNLKEMARINVACEEDVLAEKEEPPDMLEKGVGKNVIDIFVDHVRPE